MAKRTPTPQPVQKPTVSASEAADILGVSPRTITRLLKRGLLRGYKRTPARNSAVEIYPDSIEELKELREIKPDK